MPTYAYHCKQCGHKLDIFHKISEPARKLCPQCGHETLQRGPGGGSGLQFKGGFYKDNYDAPKVSDTTPEGTQPPSCCPCGKNAHSCSTQPKDTSTPG